MAVLGYEAEALIGTRGLKLHRYDDRARASDAIANAEARPGIEADPFVVRVRHRDGSERDLELRISNRCDDARVGGFVIRALDVTVDMARQADVGAARLYDSLTGLPNQCLLLDHVRAALTQARRTGDTVAMALLDIDQFNVVNNACGYACGDATLVAIAKRLLSAAGTSDFVARIGDDQFVVVRDAVQPDDRWAERLAGLVARPIDLPGGLELVVRASVGIATTTPASSLGPAQLLHDAQLAMVAWRAKLALAG
jgi:diguanylate cyclase (GGDEF)-like protein/PAS domain S-box-containing protein